MGSGDKDEKVLKVSSSFYEDSTVNPDVVDNESEEEDFDISPSDIYGYRAELSYSEGTPGVKSDIEKIKEQENISGEKSLSNDVVEGIAQHVRDIKSDGSRLSNEQLLGSNIDQVISDYAKKEGFGEAATDYAVTMAYFHSDAFQNRLLHSFGHEKIDDMSSDERRTYDEILNKARSASSQTDVYFIKEALNSFFLPKEATPEENRNIAFMGGGEVIGMNIAAHEVAHAVYDPTFDEIMEHRKERYGVNMESYQTIGNNPSSEKKMNETYRNILQEMSSRTLSALGVSEEDVSKKLTKDIKKAVKEDLKEHDDLRYERAADVYGVRMLMLREGLWNPFSGEELTPDKVREFKKNHPDSRIFQYWNIKEATFYLNNLADNGVYENHSLLNDKLDVASLSSANYDQVAGVPENESISRGIHT